jgi:hypothetical protein
LSAYQGEPLWPLFTTPRCRAKNCHRTTALWAKNGGQKDDWAKKQAAVQLRFFLMVFLTFFCPSIFLPIAEAECQFKGAKASYGGPNYEAIPV